MMFAKPLRERVRAGEITTSVRIWIRPHVKVGGRYPLLDGHIEVTRLQEVDLEALMETARHGRGERVFIVDFVFVSGSGG